MAIPISERVANLETEFLKVWAEFAALRLVLTLDLGWDPFDVEEKYNPRWAQQPRAPRGTSIGGQWIDSATSGGDVVAADSRRPSIQVEAIQSFWRGVGWSAARLRDAQGRVTRWVDENAPGALDAAARVPDAFNRLLFSIAGTEGERTYAEFTAMMADGGTEATRRYREYVDGQVARGVLTRQQADDATYLLATGAAGAAIVPIGGRLRPLRHLSGVTITARLGLAKARNYRATFFAAYPELRGRVEVHHAVEQRVLKRFPGLIEPLEMHSLENLRGIDSRIASDLHQGHIRMEWNDFYEAYPDPTRDDLLRMASDIDRRYGHLFTPPIEPRDQ